MSVERQKVNYLKTKGSEHNSLDKYGGPRECNGNGYKIVEKD